MLHFSLVALPPRHPIPERNEDPVAATGPLMVLDSAGLWFRAFHSVPERITGPHGEPVNAVRGFCDMTAALVRQYSPTGLIAALDVNWRPAWRVELFHSYKAHRVAEDGSEDAPSSLAPQVETIKELLRALGITVAGAAESEADDVMAEFACKQRETILVTGDRDILQLASPSTEVVYIGAGMKKQQVYTPGLVAEKFELPVEDDAGVYADYAVLVGDNSDGLPGVPGVGAKTAAKLLREFGDLDGIVRAAGDDSSRMPIRQRDAVLDNAGYLRSAREIVTLGSRRFELDITGDADGRSGPVDEKTLERIVEQSGQERAIGRLRDALSTLTPA